MATEAKIYKSFKASNGWLGKFKSNYNLSLKNISKEVKKLKVKETFKDLEEDIKDFYNDIDKKRVIIEKQKKVEKRSHKKKIINEDIDDICSNRIFLPQKHSLKRTIIFNTDESCFRYQVPVKKAVGPKSTKRLIFNTIGGGGSKESFTLSFGITSEGYSYPPSVIIKGLSFKRKKIKDGDDSETIIRKMKWNEEKE